MKIKFLVVGGVAMLGGAAFAGLPPGQLVTSAFDFRPIVRVESDGQYGTGSVIGQYRYANGQRGKLCVLTCDHVVSATDQTGAVNTNLTIQTRNPDGSLGAPVTRTGTVIGRQGHEGANGNAARKWDLAVVEVDWGFIDTEFELLAAQRYSVDVWTNTDLNFTSAGFGATGALTTNGGPINTGYRHLNNVGAHNDKKERFWNNRVTLAPNNTPSPGGYVHDGLEWVLDNIDPSFHTGEGSGLPGDSGSPLLFREPDGTYQPDVSQVYRRSLRGVFNAFQRSTFDGGYDVDWGYKGFAVRITEQSKAWIDERCMAVVPEPASMAALAFGVLPFLRRRKK